jgi:hypothetical protein
VLIILYFLGLSLFPKLSDSLLYVVLYISLHNLIMKYKLIILFAEEDRVDYSLFFRIELVS